VSAFSRKMAPWAVAAIAGGMVIGLLAAYPTVSKLTREMGVPVGPATALAEPRPAPLDGGNALAYANALQAND